MLSGYFGLKLQKPKREKGRGRTSKTGRRRGRQPTEPPPNNSTSETRNERDGPTQDPKRHRPTKEADALTKETNLDGRTIKFRLRKFAKIRQERNLTAYWGDRAENNRLQNFVADLFLIYTLGKLANWEYISIQHGLGRLLGKPPPENVFGASPFVSLLWCVVLSAGLSFGFCVIYF